MEPNWGINIFHTITITCVHINCVYCMYCVWKSRDVNCVQVVWDRFPSTPSQPLLACVSLVLRLVGLVDSPLLRTSLLQSFDIPEGFVGPLVHPALLIQPPLLPSFVLLDHVPEDRHLAVHPSLLSSQLQLELHVGRVRAHQVQRRRRTSPSFRDNLRLRWTGAPLFHG
jgi:hypothetical protein